MSEIEEMHKTGKGKNETKEKDKLDRYTGLIHAIEFFSQRFSLENIERYIFQFTKELLRIDTCCFYALEEEEYHLVNQIGYDQKKVDIRMQKTREHDQVVYFHPGLLERDYIEILFAKEFVEVIDPKYAIPLIMDKVLYGFLFVQKKKEDNSVDDKIIAEALMNLYGLALTNYDSYTKLETTKRKLDAKVFNLFVINQASKALLSELDTEQLYNLSLSVFAELTQSRITSLFILDSVTSRYEHMGMIDVFEEKFFQPMYLIKNQEERTMIPMLVDCQDDYNREEFSTLFRHGIKELAYYEPRYIVNLVNGNELLGFITLSEKVNGEEYESSVFELIESLASAIYIAASNANNIAKSKAKSDALQNKFKQLKILNRLVKNLNGADSIGSLAELAIDTMKISLGFKTTFIALYEGDGRFKITRDRNLDVTGTEFSLIEYIDELENGNFIIEYSRDEVAYMFSEFVDDDIYEKIQGLLLVPILIEDIEDELLAVVGLFDVDNGVLASEENILTAETLCNQISPFIKQLQFVEKMKKEYVPNYKGCFLEQIEKGIEEAKLLDTEFYIIIFKKEKKSLFAPSFEQSFIEKYRYSYVIESNIMAFVRYNEQEANEIMIEEIDCEKFFFAYGEDFSTKEELLKKIDGYIM